MLSTGPLTWPGGEHEFALPLGRLRALQTATGAGPQEIYRRLIDGTWRVDDLVETIRHGLIGAEAMEPSEAGPEVVRLFTLHPLTEFVPVAQHILGVALVGPEDDPVGKPAGATMPPQGPGNGQSSTGTAP